MTLTQIRVQVGEVKRHSSFTDPPVVEIHLLPGQKLVDFDIQRVNPYDSNRKTCDWRWKATLVWQDPGEQ